MAEYLIQDTTLTSIANQIRTLFDTTNGIDPANMAEAIGSANNEVNTQYNYIEQIKAALISKLSKNATIGTVTASLSSRNRTISFQNVTQQPTMFFIIPNASITLSSSYQYITGVLYNGSTLSGVYSNKKTTATVFTSGVNYSYSGTTLSVTATTPYFYNGQYQLVYIIQPTVYAKDTIQTVSTTVGTSNTRTITFFGLASDPRAFIIMPTANTTLNYSTQYNTNIVYNGSQLSQIYSNTSTATRATNYISKSYSNGTLTITLSNTPYFAANNTYKLVAVTTP